MLALGLLVVPHVEFPVHNASVPISEQQKMESSGEVYEEYKGSQQRYLHSLMPAVLTRAR